MINLASIKSITMIDRNKKKIIIMSINKKLWKLSKSPHEYLNS